MECRCLFEDEEEDDMSIGLWVAVTFFLGIAALGGCVLFLKACEKI